MSSDLPRLYPTKTRSGRGGSIPTRLYNSIYFCIEYPDGVYIDKKGRPRPELVVDAPSDIVNMIQDKDQLASLSKAERREQYNLVSDKHRRAEAREDRDYQQSDSDDVKLNETDEGSATEETDDTYEGSDDEGEGSDDEGEGSDDESEGSDDESEGSDTEETDDTDEGDDMEDTEETDDGGYNSSTTNEDARIISPYRPGMKRNREY